MVLQSGLYRARRARSPVDLSLLDRLNPPNKPLKISRLIIIKTHMTAFGAMNMATIRKLRGDLPHMFGVHGIVLPADGEYGDGDFG